MVIRTQKEHDEAKDVVEKRVKSTIIRRRAPVEEKPAEVAPVETAAAEAVPSAKVEEKPAAVAVEPKAVVEAAPVVAKPAEPVAPSRPRRVEGMVVENLVHRPRPQSRDNPLEAEVKMPRAAQERLQQEADKKPKIGMVGHINDFVTPGAVKKETWKERVAQVPPTSRKRKSQAELEEENIRRAGGLLHYADVVVGTEDVLEGAAAPEEAVEAPVIDRVFQPRHMQRKRKKSKVQGRPSTVEPKVKKVIRIEEAITVSELSQATGHRTGEIIKRLMDLGVMATANQRIEFETASLIAQEFGYIVEHTAFKEADLLELSEAQVSSGNLIHRSPVVTVMGHVDHGKTSLLDAIRKASVAEKEAGGITQHIGAYQVQIPKGTITFIDTPGHAAFTSMRARGAQATDIVILVVAADDGVMPQTIEAISHAQAAKVPIIVAVNKIDKPGAKPERISQMLNEHGLLTEEWGGDVICVPTSAKTKVGIDKLLEMILLQAEMLELKADPNIRPKGVVLEAHLDKGRGPVATVLVQEGTLKVGQYMVCGQHYGKVRAMNDAVGKSVKEAGPSVPVEVLGLSGVPESGDEAVGVADEQKAKLVTETRSTRMRSASLAGQATSSLEDLHRRITEQGMEELVVVLKADVHGSIEAVADSLSKLSTDKVKVRVLHKAVGGIVENDVMLAAASKAIVLGFNVKPDAKAREAAARNGVEIRSYRIIYEIIDDVKKAMEGLLAPEEIEQVLGQAEVREVFKVSKIGQIAGCNVRSGKVVRNAKARLLRDQVVVFEGNITSLKRFKDDAREVLEGYECGIGLENYNDIKVGDIIEAYMIEKRAVSL